MSEGDIVEQTPVGDVLEDEEDILEETGVPDFTLPTAIKKVLSKSLANQGLCRGLRECCKALDRGEAHLCVLAQNCDNPQYVKLVEALCQEHNINLIKVPDNKDLGEWAGLCKYDAEGQARKVVGASCVVVRDFGENSDALKWLLNYFKESNAPSQ